MKITYIFITSLTLCCVAFGQQERSFTVENHLRIGHDDNVTQSNDSSSEVKTLYYSDIFNLSGKYKLSGRTDLIVYWQPELVYYATNDLEDNALFLQDLYLDYAHELNEKASLVLTDRYRYSDQAVNDSGSNNQFAENVFKASVRYIIDQRNAVNTLINFTDRAYDNDSAALGATRDYEQVTFTPLYSRSLNRSGDTISLGYSITDHTLGHGAGGIDSSTLFVGYDRVFNPQFISSVQLGYTDAQIDQSGTDSDSTSPFFELGFNYRLSEKTALNASYGYSLRYTTLNLYNAEQRSDLLISLVHDLTAKIKVAGSLSLVNSVYESDFLRVANPGDQDKEDESVILSLRADYQINRNHAVEAGYQGRFRDGDLGEYDRNMLFFGWKLKI
jgi:hypothetical protein